MAAMLRAFVMRGVPRGRYHLLDHYIGAYHHVISLALYADADPWTLDRRRRRGATHLSFS